MYEHNGLAYHKVQDPRDGELHQLLLPAVLRDRVLNALHNQMGHQGIERTLSLVRPRAYWPDMYRDVESFIKKCEICTLSKMPQPKVRTLMGNLVAHKPLEVMAIDFTLLEPTSDGKENVLVMTDLFIKFTFAVPANYQKAVTTAKVLVKEWFTKYGI